jgi:hypothetical protein
MLNAHIGYGPQITIGANIVPKFITSLATGTFNIVSTYQSTALGLFFISGLYSLQTIGIGSRISRLVVKKATVHFTVPAITTTNNVDTFVGSAIPMSNAQLGMNTYIA